MSATRDEVLRAMAEAMNAYGATWNLRTREERLLAALAAAEQAGWALVPVEPTEEMIEDMAIKLYEERARNRGLPMAKWENAPELVRSLERRDAATAYRLVIAAAPKVGE